MIYEYTRGGCFLESRSSLGDEERGGGEGGGGLEYDGSRFIQLQILRFITFAFILCSSSLLMSICNGPTSLLMCTGLMVPWFLQPGPQYLVCCGASRRRVVRGGCQQGPARKLEKHASITRFRAERQRSSSSLLQMIHE